MNSSPARRTAIAQRTDLSSKDGASSLADVTVKITAEPTLLIIPCSGRKASGSQPSGTARALLDDLPADLASRLIAARNAVAVAAHLDESTLMPAWRRNAGTLYQCAFLPGEDPEGMRWFKHLLILSGGYGVVRAIDQIGTYDLAMDESLWPRGLLQKVIVAYARREEIRHVIAIASQTTDYAKILRRVDWRSSGADTVMLLTPETAPGAMVKAPRAIGEALRTLTTTGLSRDWRSSDGLRMLQHLIFARVWP
jgi:hypothetical protein